MPRDNHRRCPPHPWRINRHPPRNRSFPRNRRLPPPLPRLALPWRPAAPRRRHRALQPRHERHPRHRKANEPAPEGARGRRRPAARHAGIEQAAMPRAGTPFSRAALTTCPPHRGSRRPSFRVSRKGRESHLRLRRFSCPESTGKEREREGISRPDRLSRDARGAPAPRWKAWRWAVLPAVSGKSARRSPRNSHTHPSRCAATPRRSWR